MPNEPLSDEQIDHLREHIRDAITIEPRDSWLATATIASGFKALDRLTRELQQRRAATEAPQPLRDVLPNTSPFALAIRVNDELRTENERLMGELGAVELSLPGWASDTSDVPTPAMVKACVESLQREAQTAYQAGFKAAMLTNPEPTCRVCGLAFSAHASVISHDFTHQEQRRAAQGEPHGEVRLGPADQGGSNPPLSTIPEFDRCVLAAIVRAHETLEAEIEKLPVLKPAYGPEWVQKADVLRLLATRGEK